MEHIDVADTFVRFRRLVLAAAYRVLHDADAAEEVAQNVWVRLLTTRRRPRTENALASWLRVAARRAALDHIRADRRARALADVLDRQGANDSCSSSQLDRGDVIEAVRRALVNLTPRQRAVVTLRLLEGCSVRDSAIRLGVAEGTVKATLSQARRSLRATLTDHR
ncbi:MAG TPA: sigma-70 family RNA polymerase sigma factor [Gemmatimonadales bacterium]|nr:sigma-70 family RNA polymerase sigma factor [Gemmatimonadales bacterium]